MKFWKMPVITLTLPIFILQLFESIKVELNVGFLQKYFKNLISFTNDISIKCVFLSLPNIRYLRKILPSRRNSIF